MIIKPTSDTNDYTFYQLENGIKVVNVQDTESSNSTVTVSVNTGNLQDPFDVQGLAHFLEHMLFMGSTKYPDENDFGSFIKKNNGNSNAFTSDEHTTYFFTIDTTAFEEALDKLSQFFISPLISKSSLEKEINAVNSEHIKNIPSEDWRFKQVVKQIAKENSEFRKYSCGTKDTLTKKFTSEEVVDYNEMRKELVNFYEKYYTSNNIQIVTISQTSVKQQRAIVEAVFSKVLNKDKPEIKEYVYPFELNPIEKFKFTEIRTLKDTEQLTFLWHIPKKILNENTQLFNDTYESFVVELIGDEVDNSLTSELYKEGLITDLITFPIHNDSSVNMVAIKIYLTKKGLNSVGDVIDSVFRYMDVLKQLINDRSKFIELFTDYLAIKTTNFNFRPKIKDIDLALLIVDLLSKKEPKYCLGGDIIEMTADENDYSETKKYIENLNISNCLVFLSHKDAEVVNTETWFEVEYSFKGDIGIVSFPRKGLDLDIRLPEKNKFIPTDLSLVDDISDKMETIEKNCFLRVTNFGKPRGIIKTVVFTNARTIEQITLLNLYLETKFSDVQRKFYDAMKAEYTIKFNNFASSSPLTPYFAIITEGFSNKVDQLHKDIMDFVFSDQLSEKGFESTKYKQLKNLENTKMDSPVNLIFRTLDNITSQLNILPENKIKIVEEATIDAMLNNFSNLKFNPYSFYVGNFRRDRLKLYDTSIFQTELFDPVDIDEEKVVLDEEYERYLKTYNIKEDGLLYYYDFGDIDGDNYLKKFPYVKLLNLLISNSFFDEIRTKNQVGYIAQSSTFILGSLYNSRIILGFVAQSGVKTVDEMEILFDEYFKNIKKVFLKNESDFETSKQNLINQLEQPETSDIDFLLKDMNEILDIRPENYIKKLIERLKSITYDDTMKFFDRYAKSEYLKKIKVRKLNKN